MKKIYFLLSHAVQYHSPLFDQMTIHSDIECKVYYCSSYGLSKEGKRFHPEFGELPNWDIGLVKNHHYCILKNHSLSPSIFKGFWGLINLNLYSELKRDMPDVLIIYGWKYFSLIWGLMCCKILGIKTYVRGDNTLHHEKHLSPLKKIIKKWLYGKILFRLFDRIGFVGEENKQFFKKYDVSDDKLTWLPHAIDNQRFRQYYLENVSYKKNIKSRLGILSDFTILFVGRLHEVKRPIDIIKSILNMKRSCHILFVGDGDLKKEILDFCKKNKFEDFTITGFVNQSDILKYYLISDLFILPSRSETWGLVVNEALNFNLPVIVSNKVGCSLDLCTEQNGFIFEMGNIAELSSKIRFMKDNSTIRVGMGKVGGQIVANYSYDTTIKHLIESLVNLN